MSVEFNRKLYYVYTKMNGKFESLNTHVKNLDTQVAHIDETVRRQ